MVLEGSECILGVKENPDSSFKQQRDDINAMSGSQLAELGKKPENFMLKCVAGSLVVLPAGFYYASFAPASSLQFRWSFSRLSNEPEAQIVSRMTNKFMEALAQLSSTQYGQWEQYLHKHG